MRLQTSTEQRVFHIPDYLTLAQVAEPKCIVYIHEAGCCVIRQRIVITLNAVRRSPSSLMVDRESACDCTCRTSRTAARKDDTFHAMQKTAGIRVLPAVHYNAPLPVMGVALVCVHRIPDLYRCILARTHHLPISNPTDIKNSSDSTSHSGQGGRAR